MKETKMKFDGKYEKVSQEFKKKLELYLKKISVIWQKVDVPDRF